MKRIIRHAITLVSILLVCCAITTGCKKKTPYYSIEGIVWNTGYHITYQGEEALADSVLPILKEVEESVSVFSPTSVVSSINKSIEGETDAIFRKVYEMSVRINKESDGYFDPTLAPLIEAYGFAGKEGSVPDEHTRDSIMQYVGLEKSSIHGSLLTKKDSRLQFNFSAIAKGYGCDAVGEMFKRNGCRDFMVEIGGEVYVSGLSPQGEKWHIQVDKPVFSADGPVHEAQVVIAVTDCGIASSGNYRNYKQSQNGKRIGHTFDPHTGAPAVNDLLSATIIAPTCMEADAYATACMAMGFEKAQSMIERLGLKALLINDTEEVWMSEGFKNLIVNK